MNNEYIKIISYLTLLELPTNELITTDKVKSKFRKLSFIYHPDTGKEQYKDGKKFIEIKNAKDYLINNINYVNNLIRNNSNSQSNYKSSYESREEEYQRWKKEEELHRKKEYEERIRKEYERKKKEEELRIKKEQERKQILNNRKKEIINKLKEYTNNLDCNNYNEKNYKLIMNYINILFNKINNDYYINIDNLNKDYLLCKRQISKVKTLAQIKKIKLISTISLSTFFITLILIFCVFIPLNKYNKAINYINQNKYDAATSLLKNNIIGDSKKQLYIIKAKEAFDSGDYETGIDYIISIGGKVRIEYDTNGGSSLDDSIIFKNDYKYITCESTKRGYSFSNWEIKDYYVNNKSKDYQTTIYLKANWSIINYIISYDLDGGQVKSYLANTYNINSAFKIDNPTKDGYTFSGWEINDSYVVIKDFEITKGTINNICLKAIWKEKQYTLTIKDYYGLNNDLLITQDYGTRINVESPIRTGYTFAGFSYSIPMTMPYEDIVIETYWKIKQYTLTINYNDGITDDLILKQNYDSEIYIEEPRRLGYTFDSWSEILPSKMPDENMYIYAIWKVNQYSLTIKDYYGLNNDLVIKQDYDTRININNPTKTGYDFIKYSEELPEYMVAENQVLEISWVCHVKYKIENNYAVITGCNSSNNIVVLDKYDGYSTIRIDDNAFKDCINIKTIELPNTINEIGNDAFSGCSNLLYYEYDNAYYLGNKSNQHLILMSVKNNFSYNCEISPTCKIIAPKAFENCLNLQTIDIPNSVVNIEDYSFSGCSSLKDIVIPNSVTNIGFGIFYNCSSIEKLEVPYIGNDKNGSMNSNIGYFFGTKGYLLNSQYVPSSLKNVIVNNATILGEGAFYGCNNIECIILSNTISSISSITLKNCTSLIDLSIPFIGSSLDNTKDYYLSYFFGSNSMNGNASYVPSTLKNLKITNSKRIENNALSNCTSLETVILSDNLISIGDYSFYGCSQLNKIDLPNTLEDIGKYAFSGCSSLTDMIIPKNTEIIGEKILEYCYSLQKVEIPFIGNSVDDSDGRFYKITGTTPLQNLKTVIVTNTTNLPNDAFSGYQYLTSIVLTEPLVLIGSSAFSGCSNLVNIELPNTLITICSNAFKECYKLTNIELPNNLKNIGQNVFYDCSSLTSVNLPNGLLEIGSACFFYCSSLKSITIPEKIDRIGASMFQSCTSLEEIIISNNVTIIEKYAFAQCRSLKNITMSNQLIEIHEGAFDECTGLKEIIIPNTVKKIGKNCFRKCTSLEFVELSTSIKEIEENTFYECTSLEEIIIPGSVKNIGSYAFYGCTSLKEIIIPRSVITIGTYAFYNCSSLILIAIPKSVIEIGSYAIFANCYCSILCEAESFPDGWNERFRVNGCISMNENLDKYY